MSEAPGKPPDRRRNSLIAIAAVCVVAVAAGVYLIAAELRKPQAPTVTAPNATAARITKELATGSLTAFVVKPTRQPVADLAFTDTSGNPRSLSAWRGRIVLVNLWATWCGPCRKEMPSLAALQRSLGSKDFEVVAISLDRKGKDVAAPFLAENQAADLVLYLDPSSESLDRLKAVGLPVSVLIDRDGNEIGRLLGPADWATPEAAALIKAAIAEKASG
jgi:thiol-disulfide isomerase/thioredoxin